MADLEHIATRNKAASENQDARAALTPEQRDFFDKVIGIGPFAEIKDATGAWPDHSYIKQELIARWGPEGPHTDHLREILDNRLARYEIQKERYSQK